MANEDKKLFDSNDANLDPLTQEPGAHPVGTGIGAAGAGAIGAVIGGVVAGPIGAVVGAAIGSVGGGLVGKGAAEAVNPTVEDEYWRNNYASRPYAESDRQYEDYQPAYQLGYENYDRYAETGRSYDEVEPDLQRDYETNHSGAGLAWDKAKHATRDAWERAADAVPGVDRDRTDSAVTSDQNAATVRLYEERLVADKHRDKTGEVVIGKRVETETANVSVPIEKERVVIERVTPTDVNAVSSDAVAFGESDIARMEVYEEVPDIRKEAVVRQDVSIRKEVDQSVVNAEEEVRREELDIDTEGQPVVRRGTDEPRNRL